MKVKIFSTQMGEREVETSATTWGDLQRELNNAGIKHEKMKAVIGESKLTLEADGASLPTTGFTLFLMNKKTKAGSGISTMSYKELRGSIKDILATNEVEGKAHFNVGKNYTTKGTEILRDLLASWSGVIVETKVEAPKKVKKEKKSKHATAVKAETKQVKQEEPVTEEAEINAADYPELKVLNDAIRAIAGLDITSFDETTQGVLNNTLGNIRSEFHDFQETYVFTVVEILREEREAKEKAENARIDAQAKVAKENKMRDRMADMMSEFSDVTS